MLGNYLIWSSKALSPPKGEVAAAAVAERQRDQLEGQGNLVSRLIRGITGVTIWVIGVLNLLPKSQMTLQDRAAGNQYQADVMIGRDGAKNGESHTNWDYVRAYRVKALWDLSQVGAISAGYGLGPPILMLS